MALRNTQTQFFLFKNRETDKMLTRLLKNIQQLTLDINANRLRPFGTELHAPILLLGTFQKNTELLVLTMAVACRHSVYCRYFSRFVSPPPKSMLKEHDLKASTTFTVNKCTVCPD